MKTLLSSPGVRGLLTAICIFIGCFLTACINLRPDVYRFEARGPGSFEAGLARYIRLVEIILGLGTGSIVVLAGSSILRSGGKLPGAYGSPLVLLAASVVCMVSFIALLIYYYEESLHDPNFYSHHKIRLVTALGFSGLLCFALGYIWLGFALVSV
jgi:ATP/ADP translocase